jgi:hypothetical protein
MIYEVLNEVAATKNKEQKIQILRQNNSPALREVLRYAFIPELKFVVSKSNNVVIDRATPEGSSWNNLHNEIKRFYVFVDPMIERMITGGKQTKLHIKQRVFDQVLENIHAKETDVVYALLEGTFSEKYGVTKKLVEETFPNLIRK